LGQHLAANKKDCWWESGSHLPLNKSLLVNMLEMVNITANNKIDGLNPEATLRLEKMT
jgi:hypothetical protein